MSLVFLVIVKEFINGMALKDYRVPIPAELILVTGIYFLFLFSKKGICSNYTAITKVKYFRDLIESVKNITQVSFL